jgi:hypothetical protein
MPLQGDSDQALHSLVEKSKRLRGTLHEFSILNDLARAISASLNTQEIIQTIVRRSLRALNAEQGVITLVEEQSGQSMKTLLRTMVSSSEHEQLHLSQALLGWTHLNKKAIVINDPKTDHGRGQTHPVVRTAKGFDSEAGKPAEGSTGLPTKRDAPKGTSQRNHRAPSQVRTPAVRRKGDLRTMARRESGRLNRRGERQSSAIDEGLPVMEP